MPRPDQLKRHNSGSLLAVHGAAVGQNVEVARAAGTVLHPILHNASQSIRGTNILKWALYALYESVGVSFCLYSYALAMQNEVASSIAGLQ